MTGQQLEQRTPEQQLVAAVRSDSFREQVRMAVPPTVTPERFVRITTTAIMANPEIAKLEQTSVLRALVQCAAMGLMPDGKQAAITPRKGKAVLVPMIQGFRDIAADHGWTLRTAVVYANDEFRHAVVDGEETINHAPVRPGAERGSLVAAYAIAKHRDGRRMMTVLHPEDVAKRRQSSAYDAVWNDHPAAMWEKSAGRDLFAQLGLGELDERATKLLDATRTDPDEAARTIYGAPVDARTAGALPAPAAVADSRPGMTTSPPPAENPVGDSQQAAAAVRETAAAAAPGEPEPEPEPAFAAPLNARDDPTVAAANAAAQYQIPNGTHKGLSLAELHGKGPDGERWLKWALKNIQNPAGYRDAIWEFCRVYAPDLYEEAAAREAAD